MKFDVIVGNPPYQLNDGGGTGSSAKPIYHLFIAQAKKLNPKFLSMIIPARWYSGGKGLDEFRAEMLNDQKLRKLIDYPDSRECFPGVDIAGGVCYFLWENSSEGKCEVTTIRKNESNKSFRLLNEFDNFVRDNVALEVVHKVRAKSQTTMDTIVSSRNPFGLSASVKPSKKGDLELISSSGVGRISSDEIITGKHLVEEWKVLISKASNDHGGQPDKEGKRRIFSRIEVMPPNTICTESYLTVGPFENQVQAENMVKYLKTKFCRFLVSTILLTQNITKSKFSFVPVLNMNEEWTDLKLFKKFHLESSQIEFIENLIRPID